MYIPTTDSLVVRRSCAGGGGVMSPSTFTPLAVLPPHNNPVLSFHSHAWAAAALVHQRRRSS